MLPKEMLGELSINVLRTLGTIRTPSDQGLCVVEDDLAFYFTFTYSPVRDVILSENQELFTVRVSALAQETVEVGAGVQS